LNSFNKVKTNINLPIYIDFKNDLTCYLHKGLLSYFLSLAFFSIFVVIIYLYAGDVGNQEKLIENSPAYINWNMTYEMDDIKNNYETVINIENRNFSKCANVCNHI
jgi:hypothetical protein